jgi:hypothetical protein
MDGHMTLIEHLLTLSDVYLLDLGEAAVFEKDSVSQMMRIDITLTSVDQPSICVLA